jgi:MFS family permease
MKSRSSLIIIFIASFFFSIHLATTSYINSSFLGSLIPGGNVGIFYALASFATILILFFLPSLLKRIGNRTFFGSAVFLSALSLMVFIFGDSPLLKLFFFCVYFMVNTAIIFSIDIFIEHFSKKSDTGEKRGMYMTLTNLAWILSPLLAGILLENYGFKGLYTYAIIMIIPVFFIVNYGLSSYKEPKYKELHIRETILKFFKNKDLSIIWFCNFILQFFYVWMVIYMPLYLHDTIGFSFKEIGLIFTIMLIPFVLIEFPIGKLADKKYGEKEFLVFGFIITAIFTAMIYTTNSNSILIWAVLLFCTRIGASFIEIMVETYFFKKTQEKDSGFVGIYRGASPFAYLVAPSISAIIMIYWHIPLLGLFPILSGILMLGFIATLFLQDTK